MRELVRELALALRERVLPQVGSHAARAHAGGAAGGDVTFAIDADAEEFLHSFLRERAPGVAFYSEDAGLVTPNGATPRHVLIVDPVDGTRPALAGLESCCVSVAAAPYGEGVAMADVSAGCVVEIPSGRMFLAERGAGLIEGGPARLSANERLDRMFWTFGYRGRPARPLTEVLAELIDISSVGGASFDLGSACFDTMCVVDGRLDAYVEPGPLLVERVAGMREEFERVGGGAVLNNSPYDLAAAALIASEAGAVVTDAAGDTFDERPLLGSGAEFQLSVAIAANRTLHEQLVSEVAAGLTRLSGPRGDANRARKP
ncbi:MAG TPA: inositol monophosphatase family protein [Thermoleophilaceae bacterium]|nr:inositol monophosphatase family protein [Thermoleophilaceae bacterium]